MPSTFEVRIDVGPAIGIDRPLRTAVRIVVPDRPNPDAPALFGFPGGGYNRHYFDLEIDGHPGYSQARHHSMAGSVFIACDHLGVGESDTPDIGVTVATVARANAETARLVLKGLRAGTLHADLAPLEPSAAIGIGQSFGGFLLTIAQASSPIFDGIALLGWSAIITTPPWPSHLDQATILAGGAGNGLDHPKRPWFHTDEVPRDIIELDMTKIPGSSASHAAWSTPAGAGGPMRIADRDPLTAGVVATEAAAIRVPVFVGAGEIDVVPDPWREPSAYRGSDDVTVCRFPRMAHMHNFAVTRRSLWERLDDWAAGVARQRAFASGRAAISSGRRAPGSAMAEGTGPR